MQTKMIVKNGFKSGWFETESVRHMITGVVCCAVIALFSTQAAAGPVLPLDENSNSWIRVCAQGQLHYSYVGSAADKADFFLRRGRIILDGQLVDGVTFYTFTDIPNEGKSGTAASAIVQEAWMDFSLLGKHSIVGVDPEVSWIGDQGVRAGLILLPFSFEVRSSSSRTLGVDVNGEVIKMVNSLNSRDNGAELHGNFGPYVSYIAGVFDGYDATGSTKNPNAPLRTTGHIAVNLLGKAETGTGYTQERLNDDNFVSLGVGVDRQDRASFVPASTNSTTREAIAARERDSKNWVVDLEAGCKLGLINLTVNGGYYNWDNSAFKGTTWFVEDGIRYIRTQLCTKYTMQDPDNGRKLGDYTVGLNYFLKGHNARVGVEYRWGDSPHQVLGGLQFLL